MLKRLANFFNVPINAFLGEKETISATKRQIGRDCLSPSFDAQFYGELQISAERMRVGAKDLHVEKLVVLHYICRNYQIGFRAYLGLFPIERDYGSLPLYVTHSRNREAKVVNYFFWNDARAAGRVETAEADKNNNTPPTITVNSTGPRNVCIFQYYDDPVRPDFFHLNAFPIPAEGVFLDHYVVVLEGSLRHWHPKRNIVNFTPDAAIHRVDDTYHYQELKSGEKMKSAGRILRRFLGIPDSNLLSESKETQKHFRAVRRSVENLFKGNVFSPLVKLFWLRIKAKDSNLFLAYVFPPRFER